MTISGARYLPSLAIRGFVASTLGPMAEELSAEISLTIEGRRFTQSEADVQTAGALPLLITG
jgi:hypothetical protein